MAVMHILNSETVLKNVMSLMCKKQDIKCNVRHAFSALLG